jgi:thioredoxin reductase (NADPH)
MGSQGGAYGRAKPHAARRAARRQSDPEGADRTPAPPGLPGAPERAHGSVAKGLLSHIVAGASPEEPADGHYIQRVDLASRILSSSQLAMLADHGEERTAELGERLFEVGDQSYPFIAIVEGEVAVLDGAGAEIVRHGASGFLGEMNLLTGQTVFLTAVATKPMRYIAVDRQVLRQLLFEDGSLSDLLLTAFVERRELLQQREGIGIEIIGPRDWSETRRLQDFARRLRLPYSLITPQESEDAAALVEQLDGADLPLVRLPGGGELQAPSNGELSRALGIGLELERREEVDLVVIGGGPAGLGAAVYGASEGLDTLLIESTALGGQAGTSRRIENYLGFPAGISGTELTSRAATQARKFGARTATPYSARSLEPGGERHLVKLEEGNEVTARAVLLATGAEYRRLPVADLDSYEGISVFYAAGPPEAQLCGAQRVGVIGGGNSAAQAAVWLARGGALVTLMHRRADLRETMSHYLINELERYGVSVRDRSEIASLHGHEGQLEAVTLTDGAKLAFSFLFLFLGAVPCTDWLGDVVGRDADGFILTGTDAGADGLLETSVPGVYAAGDVRAGSTKRCATAVGEGSAVVRFVHEHLSAQPSLQ